MTIHLRHIHFHYSYHSSQTYPSFYNTHTHSTSHTPLTYPTFHRAVGTPCISSPQPPTGHNSPTPVYSDSDFEVESELPSLSNTILNETLANMDVKSRKYQEVINGLFLFLLCYNHFEKQLRKTKSAHKTKTTPYTTPH